MQDDVFCFPPLNSILYDAGFILGAFVLAYIFYLLILFGLRRAFRSAPLLKFVVEKVRPPLFLILIELATYFACSYLKLDGILTRLIFTAVMLSFGWFLGRVAKGAYLFQVEKVGQKSKNSGALITQFLFLYRIAIVMIFLLTLAGIFMIFPYIKSVGIGILSSAGIAGIAMGVAARPVLLNCIAGFQIAFTKTVKIGDAVFIQDQFGRIEHIHLTYVVVRLWDLKRMIIPTSEFVEKPFQNWDMEDPELIGAVLLYCDYSVPVDAIRARFKELIDSHPLHSGTADSVHVTNVSEQTVEIRLLVSGANAGDTFELRCFIREKMIEFLQKEYKQALPSLRYKNFETPAERL